MSRCCFFHFSTGKIKVFLIQSKERVIAIKTPQIVNVWERAACFMLKLCWKIEWVSEYGLMEMLGCAYVCVVQWARRVTSGGSSVMCLTFFQSSLECVETRKKTDCRTAWASKNSLYKRIKCKAFAKCFKDFRIVQLWCFNIVRLVFHSFSHNYNYSSNTSYLNIINDFFFKKKGKLLVLLKY